MTPIVAHEPAALIANRPKCPTTEPRQRAASIRPLPHLRIERRRALVLLAGLLRPAQRLRDLVADVSWNYEVNKRIPPFQPMKGASWRWQQFAGPRFLVRIAGLEMHPMDGADRTGFLRDTAGIGLCNITKCCTEVCPESITITDNAIIPLKERVVDRFYDPVGILWDKLTGRRG